MTWERSDICPECGRKLKSQKSLAIGIGTVCKRKRDKRERIDDKYKVPDVVPDKYKVPEGGKR